MQVRLFLIVGAAALSVSACATADRSYGGSLAYGYGDGSYGLDCYGAYGYSAYGYGACGWYDGFFYPGYGNFVFDRHRHQHEMTMRQHDYFTRQARGPDGTSRVGLGSSGGVAPPSVSRQRPTSSNRIGQAGPRSGFSGGARGRFGSGGQHH